MRIDPGGRFKFIHDEVDEILNSSNLIRINNISRVLPFGGISSLLKRKFGKQDSTKLLEAYLSAAKEDYFKILQGASYLCRVGDGAKERSHKIVVNLSDDLILDAFACILNDKEVQITVTMGTFFGLQDILYRLACNNRFLSFHPTKDGKLVWKGCTCVWFDDNRSILPALRYYDYSFNDLSNLNPLTGSGRFASAFFSGIPLDKERQDLANLMFEISICWLFMHEEAHFTRGHLHFLKEKVGVLGHPIRMSETKNGSAELMSHDEHKVIEWMADRAGNTGCVDIFFQDHYLQYLPDYCSDNKKGWMLRLIIVSIGTLFSIFQKTVKSYGASELYPSSKSRLVSAIDQVLQRAATPLNSVSDFIHLVHFPVVGALDDLLTVSENINCDGQYAPADMLSMEFPKREKTHDLDLVDSEEDVNVISELILKRMCDDGLVNEVHPSHPPHIKSILEKKWFSELDEIHKFELKFGPELDMFYEVMTFK